MRSANASPTAAPSTAWSPLFEQARVCANHLAHFGISRYTGTLTSTKLKVTGIDLFSAGDFGGGEGTDEIVLHDPSGGVYKKLVVKNDTLVGAVLYGDTADGAWYFKLVKDASNIREIRDHLMFGQNASLGDAGHRRPGERPRRCLTKPKCAAATASARARSSRRSRPTALLTLEDVRKTTKASSSCGSCTGLVEQILAATVGSAYSPAGSKDKAVCGCTEHSHGEVREAIRSQHLLSIPEVMQTLEWQTPNGCASCRPALNYYLISTWPGEAKDDPQSRFINERAHANIQKDGTYSVVPRMWGGLTTPSELRAIADVADKYQVPTVKMTGGARVDLLGIKKDDLPRVWADLGRAGMVSGHAYGKSIRTVKTCVGAEHCRFGTQRSMAMGVKLERMLFGMWSPHKVKLAVSGCPRNCAEAGIKDVGVIGVDSGYELYVAGNGGIKTEVAQFLCKVKNDEEVMEYSCAFLQIYREEGYYLERTCHYVARVGLDHVKAAVVDDPARRKDAARAPAVCPAGLRRPLAAGGAAAGGAPRIRGHPFTEVTGMSDWIGSACSTTSRRSGSRVAASTQGDIAIFRTADDGSSPARQMPAQGRAAVAGHRPWRDGHLPAARLEACRDSQDGAGGGAGSRGVRGALRSRPKATRYGCSLT
jgi:nitrite reductase (NADH) large subunit